jgi:Tol biopolymer transport system component
LRGALACVALATSAVGLAGLEPARAAFPGANGRIVFVEDCINSPFIETIKPDGTDVQGLAFGEDPEWSADGQKIAYSNSSGVIHVMNADGSGDVSMSTFGEDPTWNPDGTQLIYHESGAGLGIVDVATKAHHTITDPSFPEEHQHPSWSPKGDKVVISLATANAQGSSVDLALVNPDGSGLTQITDVDGDVGHDSGGIDLHPSFSPDGTQIVFHANDSTTGGNVWTMSAGGGTPTQKTHLPNQGDRFPAWSPDGKEILYVESPQDTGGSTYEIHSLTPGGDRPVFHDTKKICDTDWQPTTPPLARTFTTEDERIAVGGGTFFDGSDWDPNGGPITITFDGRQIPDGAIDPAATFHGSFDLTGWNHHDGERSCRGTLKAAQDGVSRTVLLKGARSAVAALADDVTVTKYFPSGGPEERQQLESNELICHGDDVKIDPDTGVLFPVTDLAHDAYAVFDPTSFDNARDIKIQGALFVNSKNYVCVNVAGRRSGLVTYRDGEIFGKIRHAICPLQDFRTFKVPRFPIEQFDNEDVSNVQKLSVRLERPHLQGQARRAGDLKVVGRLTMDGAVLFVDGDLVVTGGIQGNGAIFVTGGALIKGLINFRSDDVVALMVKGVVNLIGTK